MPFATALSEHPLTAHATGEVVGAVLEALGPSPDLAVVFVTGAHGGALEDVAATIRSTLAPGALLGCTASSVVGGPREVEEQAAVVLWAASGPSVTPVRLDAVTGPEGVAVTGWPAEDPPDAACLLLLADPFTFPTEGFLRNLRRLRPTLPVVGGLASGAEGPGGNRLVVDDRLVTDGAVGALVGGDVEVRAVISQGCRPVGDPFVVTRAERNVIHELAGQPSLERLQQVVAALDHDERQLLAQGIHLGRVIDEQRDEFERGDFLVRNVIGADRENGAIAVGDTVEVGATVQFHVRDAESADDDLRALLAGHEADGALLFTCNGRGIRLFGTPDHDAAVVVDILDGAPTAGMFCQGELGPVGGESFLHSFTASVVLFRDGDGSGAAGPG